MIKVKQLFSTGNEKNEVKQRKTKGFDSNFKDLGKRKKNELFSLDTCWARLIITAYGSRCIASTVVSTMSGHWISASPPLVLPSSTT